MNADEVQMLAEAVEAELAAAAQRATRVDGNSVDDMRYAANCATVASSLRARAHRLRRNGDAGSPS